MVPAAGVGRRMGGPKPKQYLSLGDRSILAWTLERLLSVQELAAVCVVLAAEDPYWPELGMAEHPRLRQAVGGNERSDSVLQGLLSLSAEAGAEDWVLVHDAARPLVQAGDVLRLMETCLQAGDGGLLAVPVRDTLKRQGEGGRVAVTVDRAGLWQAQTPQMFPFGLLREALVQAQRLGRTVTDEAQAMEAMGHRPLLVEGNANNLKLTLPEDLLIAERLLLAPHTGATHHEPILSLES